MIARIIIMSQQRRTAATVKLEDDTLKDDGDTYASGSCLDCFCLALGLLTNLVQAAEDAVDIIRETSKQSLHPYHYHTR